tara:strand:+ start:646 stop:1461 length:816 start_codon:yes stop_codon:yes gene_type:complete
MKWFVLTIGIMWGVALSAPAALLIENETKDANGKLQHKGVIEIRGRSVKMTSSNNKQYQIFRGDRKKMYMVDPATRTYMVFDEQSMEAIGEKMSSVMADASSQLAKAMEGMTEEQKAAMQKYMPNVTPPTQSREDGPDMQVKKTAGKRTVDGYPCVRYDLLKGGAKEAEMWVTPWSKVKHGKAAYGAYTDMARFMEGMMKALAKTPMLSGAANSMSGMGKVDGFPVLIRHFSGGRLESETTFTSFTKSGGTGEIDIPTNFTRRDMMSGFGR